MLQRLRIYCRAMRVMALNLLVVSVAIWFAPAPVAAHQEHAPPSASEEPQHDAEQPPSHDEAAAHEGGEHHSDPGLEKAREMAVPEAPPWYRWVVIGSAILFILACTVGSIASMSQKPVADDAQASHGGHDPGHGAAHEHGAAPASAHHV